VIVNIEGSSAIVTGGASGLGAATVRRLAADGMKVVVLDLQDALGEEMAAEVDGGFVHADVTDADQVQGAVDAAIEMAPLRVLVNCAGIGPPARTVARDGSPHDLSDFAKVISINLVGTFNCIRLAAAAMVSNDPLDHNERGAIVNTASVAAYDGQIGQAAYAASKGGIVGMTLPVARDLASAGIRVNTIAPGIIDTPLLAGLPEPARESLAQQVLNPKRLGRPDEFADLVHLLVTHSYMNGETIRMDGGIRMGPK
jgi:NAD(P)-dependent dehydrogenase (short-subunit alcohol dehydrogenase family)